MCRSLRIASIAASSASLRLALAALVATASCGGEAPQDPAPETPPSAPTPAQGPPEGTDIWILDLQLDDGALRGVEPRNLTSRPGYDNQPLFTPSGQLLYVQMEGEKTDLWNWDPATDSTTRLTLTPEDGEYSPTPMPGGGGGISFISSKTDTTGRLWRMDASGGDREVVFPDIVPVGYHAWVGADHVALWRLQEPSLLQLVDLATGAIRDLATGVGRSPQSIPGRRAVSYTRATETGTVVEEYDLDLDRTLKIASLPEGGEFHAWTPDGVLLATAGPRVLARRDGSWVTIADLDHLDLRLSRLAVSADGNRLAVVGEPGGG